VANKDLLANLYQHLLQECHTAGAADMNNYCPLNSSTQVAGQFLSQAYLFVYTVNCKSAKPWAGQQVSGDHLFNSSVNKQMFIGQQILLVTPLCSPGEFSFLLLGL